RRRSARGLAARERQAASPRRPRPLGDREPLLAVPDAPARARARLHLPALRELRRPRGGRRGRGPAGASRRLRRALPRRAVALGGEPDPLGDRAAVPRGLTERGRRLPLCEGPAGARPRLRGVAQPDDATDRDLPRGLSAGTGLRCDGPARTPGSRAPWLLRQVERGPGSLKVPVVTDPKGPVWSPSSS